jgi:hypothetical protein
MAECPIVWSSKQQAIVAQSSCEAEYLAVAHAIKQILWTRYLAQELGLNQDRPTVLYCDNQGTIPCTHDPEHHSKMKHIDLRIHFIRDTVSKQLVTVQFLPGAENIADLLTKALPAITHNKWIKSIHLDRDQGGVLDI